MVTASTCIQGNSVTCVIRAGRDVSASPRIPSLRAIALNWNVSQVSLSLHQKQGAFGGIQSRHARPNDVTGIS